MSFEQCPEVDTVVYLRPGTKMAPPVCYTGCEAKIIKYDLPFVLVLLPSGETISIHHLNIALHRPKRAARGETDQAGGHDQRHVPTMPKPKRLHLSEGEEEQTLW